MILSTVILAMTTSEELFDMTLCCINSLVDSEPDISIEIIVVESNKNYYSSEFQYPDFVIVIVPDGDFNFHKFLNVGIKASVGDFIALCNNDLLFHENWFKEILKVKSYNPTILSFSPNEKNEIFFGNKLYEIGHKVQLHIKGWCLVAERSTFIKIDYLDELFDFYYADNDYSMTLMMHNIKHAIVYNSYVEHLEKKSSGKILAESANNEFLSKYLIPKYLLSGHYQHVVSNEKSLAGFLKFYSKWGNPKWLYRKNKVAIILFKYNLGYFVKFMYNPRRNVDIFKK
ncbi:MAG: glycosyltransferase family 2 protein [Flavobacterium sp.]